MQKVNKMSKIDDMLDDRMSSAGEYPDFWDPEEGDILEGFVTERKDNPWAEADDDDPTQMLNVKQEDGPVLATRTHAILSRLIKQENVEVGDYVRIEYNGKVDTDGPNKANDYRLGCVKAEELEETDGGTAAAEPVNAEQFLTSLMGFHGELSVEEVDNFLNTVESFNVDAVQLARRCGYVIDGDTIRNE